MNEKNRSWYLKGLAQMSLVVVSVAELSLSTNCLWLLNQPKVPQKLMLHKKMKTDSQ